MLHRKKCKTPGCTGRTYNKSGYCDECQKLRWRQEQKDPALYSQGYSTFAWRKFAASYLLEHPTCVRCGAPATVCDHKTETAKQMIDAYGSFDLNPDKYQALCTRCNKLKATEDAQSDAEYFKQKEALELL